MPISYKQVINKVGTKYFSVLEYGATGDGSTDDSTAILAAITASIAYSGNANIIFPAGRYKINTQVLIDNSTADVNFIGYGAELVSGVSTLATSLIRISSAKKVYIKNLNINFNANSSNAHYGYRLGDNASSKYVGVARIEGCDFYNFGTESTRGILVENTPFVSGLSANFNLPSLIIDSCNFYNQNTSNTINYSTATYYGIGIQLGELTDYCRVINCSFNYIRIGVWSVAGANLDVTACNFLACLPKISGAYTYGAIYIPTGGTNNGKINIVGCKFNHNYGYCIYNTYTTTNRPMTITDNHFIANGTTAIYVNQGTLTVTRHQIKNNWFDRCSQAFTNSWTNQPFGASLQPYIRLVKCSNNEIKNNTFINDATYAVVTESTSENNLIEGNYWSGITGITSLVGTANIVSENRTDNSLYGNGDVIFDHYVNGGNVTTGKTDLYTDTLKASILANNGEKIEAEYGGVFVSSGTATRQITVAFGGTDIFDTGALTLSLSSAWTVYATIIRVSSTVVRYMVSLATQGASSSAYTAVGELTGLTLSNTNILKITGQAAGVGAATNDIVAKLGTAKWYSASN